MTSLPFTVVFHSVSRAAGGQTPVMRPTNAAMMLLLGLRLARFRRDAFAWPFGTFGNPSGTWTDTSLRRVSLPKISCWPPVVTIHCCDTSFAVAPVSLA